MKEESNPWAISVRLKHYNTDKTKFQIKHDFRIGKQPDYVESKRSKLNTRSGKKTVEEYTELLITRRALTNPKRAPIMSRAAIMTGGIITFGHLAQTEVLKLGQAKQDAMYKAVAEAIAKKLKNEVTGWAAHRDEQSPHAHFQMPSRRKGDGQLMSEVLSPEMMREIQDIAAETAQKWIAKIERGTSKEKTGARNKPVAELHRTQAEDYEDKKKRLTKLAVEVQQQKERRDKNVKRAWDARKKARAANIEASKAEKHLKNAMLYEKRAADAEAEVKKLEEQLTSLQASIDILTAAEDDLCASLSDKNDEFRRLEAATKDKKDELETVTNTVAQKKTKIASLESSNSSLRQRKASLQARLKTLSAA